MVRGVLGACACILAAACAAPPAAEHTSCPAPAACPACPACPAPAAAPERARYEPAAFDALPGWRAADLTAALRAFVEGCTRAERIAALAAACGAARAVPPADAAGARTFFETRFRAWTVANANGDSRGLVTGYYEPVLAGSRARDARHAHPVYGVPPDLVAVELGVVQPESRHLRLRGRLEGRRLVPYYSRAEIDAGPRAWSAPVLAWVEDPVELFFLQVQGSGQIRLADGSRMRVGYADQNGHPYRSIGRWLVERGELSLDATSMQGIKAWAKANPARLGELLSANPSYVFFRELPPEGGPIGALGAPLSAGYSIAVDRRHVPLGAPAYLATTWPASERPLERLVVAQDTGGAIRGIARVDFFWGSGAEAGELAGRMKQPGRLWILWPRDAGPPTP